VIGYLMSKGASPDPRISVSAATETGPLSPLLCVRVALRAVPSRAPQLDLLSGDGAAFPHHVATVDPLVRDGAQA
jgi:hypothetical protein